ncbi:hypothetical protein SAMN02982994_1878 [Azospirillum lipoferum]|nr:hypothetical protein SAMN02982994_1878 [Azospirillum lipoferum]
MTPDTSQWRIAEMYEHVDTIAAPDLAWEWLRRNGHYQQAYRHHAAMSTPRHHGRDGTDWSGRWGLRFPGQARPQRP